MTKTNALDAAIAATEATTTTTSGGVIVPMITPTALGGVRSAGGCAGLLLFADGKVAAIYATGREGRPDFSPWHKLGTVHTADTLTLKHVGPEFLADVELAPVQNGNTGEVVGGMGLITHPSFAGAFGSVGGVGKGVKWTPAQPMKVWSVLQKIVAVGGTVESVQWLRPGRLTFDGQLPIDAKGFRGDRHVVRYCFTIDYTGSGADHIMITIVRVVCCNTEAAALRDAQRSGGWLKVHHTNGIVDAYDVDVPLFLGQASASVEALATQKVKLNQIKLKKGQAVAYWNAVLDDLGMGNPRSEEASAVALSNYERRLEGIRANYEEEREAAKDVGLHPDSLRVAYEAFTRTVSHGAVVTTKRNKDGNATEFEHRHLFQRTKDPVARSQAVMSGEKQRRALITALGLAGEDEQAVKQELRVASRI